MEHIDTITPKFSSFMKISVFILLSFLAIVSYSQNIKRLKKESILKPGDRNYSWFAPLSPDDQEYYTQQGGHGSLDSRSIADTISLEFNYMDDIIIGQSDWGHRSLSWNQHIIYLGNGLVDSTERRGFSLICYDTLGNEIWRNIIEDSNYYVIQGNDLLALNDNYFYVGGIIYNENLVPWDRFLAKFDINGDTVFFKTYLDTASNFLVDME